MIGPMTYRRTLFVLSFVLTMTVRAQVLVDSIPYPAISQGFWGIHVNADTIFLGDDFSGNIYFSDHAGNILGQQPTGFGFDHGLVRRAGSYLIAQDYTTNGAHLYEVDLGGTLMNTWTFPDVIGGHSSGIGDLCADGNAVWYTMYYPDFDVDPYAYAYKWIPGDPTAIDTVPMHGEQPYGIALKGDTLFYVTDNLNGDQERIYAYDLTNEQDLGWIELPDTPIDNDQRPQGMFYDGEFLYLIANRQGGSAFAYQTVFIYAFDTNVGFAEAAAKHDLLVYPNPARDHITVELPFDRSNASVDVRVLGATGQEVWSGRTANGRRIIDVAGWSAGRYTIKASTGEHQFTRSFVVEH